jgi:hypothetical protein
MLGTIRRHLGLKIFLSYLIVILVGVIVLGSAAEFWCLAPSIGICSGERDDVDMMGSQELR